MNYYGVRLLQVDLWLAVILFVSLSLPPWVDILSRILSQKKCLNPIDQIIVSSYFMAKINCLKMSLSESILVFTSFLDWTQYFKDYPPLVSPPDTPSPQSFISHNHPASDKLKMSRQLRIYHVSSISKFFFTIMIFWDL